MDADENPENLQIEGGDGEGEEQNVKVENESLTAIVNENGQDNVEGEPAVDEGGEEQADEKIEDVQEPEDTEMPADSEIMPADETVVDPTVETEIEPVTEPGAESSAMTDVEPENETAAEPETDAAAEPETEAAAEPETETAAEPETETAAEPETETAAEPETETGAEPETDAVAEPETETEAEPAAEPETETGAEPEAEAAAEPETETGAEPETEAADEPETETGVEPATEAVAETEAEAGAEPETETGLEPETETGGELATETGAELPTEIGAEIVTEPGAEPETDTAGEPTAEIADNSGEPAPEEETQNEDQEPEEKGSVVEIEGEERTAEASDSPVRQESGVQEDVDVTEGDQEAKESDEEVKEVTEIPEAMVAQDETVAEEPAIISEMEPEPQDAFGIPEKEIKTIADSLKPSIQPQKKVPEVSKKHKKTYPYLARVLKESHVLSATRKTAPPHDYFGLIFSAESKRPPSYYHNYFLPVQKQPLRQQHLKIVGKTIPPEAINAFLKAPLHSMPLSTIKVRWMLNRRNTVYKASDLYAYLAKYGKIERVYQMTNNSALVVFEDLLSALAAIKDPRLGYPWDTLMAEWLEPRLNNRGYFKKYANIEEKPFNSERRNHDEDMIIFQQHCLTKIKK